MKEFFVNIALAITFYKFKRIVIRIGSLVGNRELIQSQILCFVSF